MAVIGNNILLYRGGVLVAGMRGTAIECECDTEEVCSPTSGQWKEYVASYKSWQVDVSYLLPAVDNINELLNVGTTYTLSIEPRTGVGTANPLTGSALLTSCKLNTPRNGLVTGSLRFLGSGPLAEAQQQVSAG